MSETKVQARREKLREYMFREHKVMLTDWDLNELVMQVLGVLLEEWPGVVDKERLYGHDGTF